MELAKKHCIPCEGGTKPLSDPEEDTMLKEINGWKIDRGTVHKIHKTFSTKNFMEGINLANKVAVIAENENHHPELFISYKQFKVEITTHAIMGLSENDYILAAKIDEGAAVNY